MAMVIILIVFSFDIHCFVLLTEEFRKIMHSGFQCAKVSLILRQWRVKCEIIHFRRQKLFMLQSINILSLGEKTFRCVQDHGYLLLFIFCNQ